MTNAQPTLSTEPLTPFRKVSEQSHGTSPRTTLPPAKKSTPAPTTSPTPPTPSPETTTPDFRELLALMMMGMAMQGGSGEDSGFSMNGLIAPLMMTLMEQLMSQEITSDTGDSQAQISQAVPNGLPVQGRFTQYFHEGHNGIDLAIVTGTPIQTTMDGTVIHAGWNNQGYGNLVIVENGPYRTYYAHLSEIPVEVGQTVRAGEVIGLSGNTGNSTGPHLHYEVRYNGQALNPEEFY